MDSVTDPLKDIGLVFVSSVFFLSFLCVRNYYHPCRGWAAEEEQRDDGTTSEEGFRLKRRFVKIKMAKIYLLMGQKSTRGTTDRGP